MNESFSLEKFFDQVMKIRSKSFSANKNNVFNLPVYALPSRYVAAQYCPGFTALVYVYLFVNSCTIPVAYFLWQSVLYILHIIIKQKHFKVKLYIHCMHNFFHLEIVKYSD